MEPGCGINHLSFVQSLKQKLQDCKGNPIEICHEEASGLVRHLELSAQELARLARKYKQLHFHCAYGDYASKLCKDLKLESSKRFKALQPSASSLSDKIKEEGRILTCEENPKDTPVLDALEERASELETKSVKVDLELAKFAINAYASRNQACHSKGLMAYRTGNNGLTRSAVDDDTAEMHKSFAENEVELAAKWRSLLLYWRERNLVLNEFGSWTEAPNNRNEGKDKSNKIGLRVDLPEFSELSRASKTALLEYIKLCPDSFDMSLFDPESETRVLCKRTNSAPDSCYGVKRKWDQISSDRNPWLNEPKVEETVHQRARVEERYEYLHQEVCRHQDRLCKIDHKASEKLLRSRLEDLQKSCRKAMNKLEKEKIAEKAKTRRAARKAQKFFD